MKATLIEIVPRPRLGRWYSGMGGERFWCLPVLAKGGWRVLDGQGLPGVAEGYRRLIPPEYGWRVRDGHVELELRLVEIGDLEQ